MASVCTNDNNTKSNVFEFCKYEGENYFDTRNTRKYANKTVDPQKLKWQAKTDYWARDEFMPELGEYAPPLTQHDLKTSKRDLYRWIKAKNKRTVEKGANKREHVANQFAMQ